MANNVTAELTQEEQHQRDLERLEKMRPIDDDFMRELFRNNIPLAQLVLRIMTGKDDLVITREETQYDLERLLGARSICLDVFATDAKGQIFNLEIQRSNKGATPKRARFHSSAIDVEFLKEKQEFDKLPTTYVIFVTENDVRKSNRPVYFFERKDALTGESFGDDEYIIFVNGAYKNPDDNSDLSKLIHDFGCNKAEDMYFDLMAERTNYYKKTPKGVSHMCKIMEDMRNDEKMQEKIRTAVRMLADGTLTYEQIAKFTVLPVEKIEELASQLASITA